jgi:hypothetical protein
MILRKYIEAIIYAAIVLLSACGGGESEIAISKAESIIIQVSAPSDFSVNEGESFDLTVSSHVVGGNPKITYEWTYINLNNEVVREFGDTINVSAPEVESDHLMLFQVQAYVAGYLPEDFSQGLPRDSVFVSILDSTPRAPIANAGPGLNVTLPFEGFLNAGESSDNRAVTSYQWLQLSGPSLQLSDSSSVRPSFSVTEPGDYVFQLTVIDADGLTDSDTVTIYGQLSQPPVAKAGLDATVFSGNLVLLDGASSTDDRSVVSFQWQQISGELVLLLNSESALSSFNAPPTAGDLVFQLTVTDADAQQSIDQITIHAGGILSQPPVASAGQDSSVFTEYLVLLDGTGSADDEAIVSYHWKQVSGANITLINSGSAISSFTSPATSGYLEFRLSVVDADSQVSTDQIRIYVGGPAPALTAQAGLDAFYYTNQKSELDGTASSPMAGITEYQWQQVSGTAVKLLNANSVVAGFEAPEEPGVLSFQLTVTDWQGSFAIDTVQIDIKSPAALQVAFPSNKSIYPGSSIDVVGSINMPKIDKASLSVEADMGLGWVSSAVSNEGLWRVSDVGINSIDGQASLQVRVIQEGKELERENYTIYTSPEFDLQADLVYSGSGDTAYAIEAERILKVNVVTGERSVLSSRKVGEGAMAGYFSSAVLDIENNRLLVGKGKPGSITEVNLSNGDRKELLTWDKGDVASIHLDAVNQRAFVSDCFLKAIFSIDLTTKIVSEISSKNRGLGSELNCIIGMAYDNGQKSIYGVDMGEKSIIKIDVETGDRNLISSTIKGEGREFRVLDSLELDTDSDRLIVIDRLYSEMTAVDINTGDRTIFSNAPYSRDHSSGITGLAASDDGNWYVLYLNDPELRKYIPASNSSVLVSGNSRSLQDGPIKIHYSIHTQQLLLKTNNGVDAINPFTGIKEFWVGTEGEQVMATGTLPLDAEHRYASSISYDAEKNRLLYIHQQINSTDSVVGFDLSTRESQIITGEDTGSGDLLENLRVISWNAMTNQAYLVEGYPRELYSLDVNSGDRSKVMDFPNVGIDSFIVTADGKTAYADAIYASAVVSLLHPIYKIDLLNKSYSVLTNSIYNGGKGLTFDEKHQLIYMIEGDSIILMDAKTEDRVIFSRN